MAEVPRTFIPAAGHDWLLFFYDPLCRWIGGETWHRQLIDQAAIRPSHRVLEIGCGTGQKIERSAFSVRLDHGFSDKLPYADDSFDRVLSAFMFHHLERPEKEKTLHETRRVLVGGGSLHLLDFGGADAGSDGIIAQLLHRSGRLRDNAEERVLKLMRNAGFADPTEVAHGVTLFGRITYYRAHVPRAESDLR